jgi:hypothetical protein
LHFSGGEVLLNKEFPKYLEYLQDVYSDKIYDKFVITNGTIILNSALIETLIQSKCWVLIDDYSDTVPLAKRNIPNLTQILCDNKIRFELNKAEFWYDLQIGNVDYENLSEEQRIKHRDGCNLLLQGCDSGRLYSCCWQRFANIAELSDMTDNDYIDIERSSKTEILEFRSGYTEKGYLDFCLCCRGAGNDCKHMLPAVQWSKK